MQAERASVAPPPEEPSVIDAGPTHRMLRRAGLVYPEPHRIILRAALAMTIAWIPLVVLAWIGGTLAVFLRDVEIHIRLLLALPIAILAEMPADRWSRQALRHFRESGIIGPQAVTGWEKTVREFRRLLDAPWPELIIVVLVVFFSWYRTSNVGLIGEVHAWQRDAGGALTAAGWWHTFVSRPLYQFVMCRWMWKLFVWSRLLYRVSRLDLSLQPNHPDRAAGLAFVGLVHGAFAPLVFAAMCGSAGTLATVVMAGEVQLAGLRWVMIGLLVVMLLIVIGPLFVFMPHLIYLKRQGQFEYGALASRYALEFDRKWIQGGAPADEPLIGSADIQSMADMGGALEPVVQMRILPIDFATLRLLIAAAALPLLPVLCLKVPITELAKRVFGLLL